MDGVQEQLQELKRRGEKSTLNNPLGILETTLTSLLPSSKENRVQTLKSQLGKGAESYSDEELETLSAQIEFLVNNLLDEYEMIVFDGKKIRELTSG